MVCKSLVNSAMLALLTLHSVAFAGSVSVVGQIHSLEGLEGVNAKQVSNEITYTLGVVYTPGDLITFTLSKDIGATSWPTTISANPIDSPNAADAIAGVQLSILNSNGNSVTYRITGVTQPDNTPGDGGTEYADATTIGARVVLGRIEYPPADILSEPLTVTVSSATPENIAFDTNGTRTANIAEARSQFGSFIVSAKFDGVIDLDLKGKAFANDINDVLEWQINNPDGYEGWLNLATVDKTVISVYGEAGKLEGLSANNLTSESEGEEGSVVFDSSASKWTATFNGIGGSSGSTTFTPPATDDNAVTLYPQAFTVEAEYSYQSAAGTRNFKTLGSFSAGKWTSNGASILIPYMPYGSTVAQVIYVSNRGSSDASISVSAFGDNLTGRNFYDLGILGTVKAKTVLKLAPNILEKLNGEGFTSGKLALLINVEASKDDIYVHSHYVSGSSPVHVPNYRQ